MIMPAFVLGTALTAVLMRQTRNSMIEILGADYIRTARAKGLAGRAVVFRHAIRNGLIPVVTILGLQMGALIGGAVVTEQIFVVPGFGRLIVEAVFTRDYPLVQGLVLITASAYVLINLLVDVSYTILDPRIRVGGRAVAADARGLRPGPARAARPPSRSRLGQGWRRLAAGRRWGRGGRRPVRRGGRWPRRGSRPPIRCRPTGGRCARRRRGRTRSGPTTSGGTSSRA